jgi:hypothetical protein
LAERLVDQRGRAVLLVGLLLINLGNAIEHPSALRLGLTAVVVVLFTTAGVVGVRQVRRARRFLAEHPGETLDR